MLFGLHFRNDNPGTAFISFADCLPSGVLCPHFKDMPQVAEENYNSVAEFDKATVEHFAGLIRVAYYAEEGVYFRTSPFAMTPTLWEFLHLVGSEI
jgi:hypothetical protein